MRHIHVSFLTPLLVLFSLWIFMPIARTLAMWKHDKPWAQALAYSTSGF
jgi:hypothetical protein